MNTRALETKDVAKTNTGPLRMLHATVTTPVISRNSPDDLKVICIHLGHVVVLYSYFVVYMSPLVMLMYQSSSLLVVNDDIMYCKVTCWLICCFFNWTCILNLDVYKQEVE